MNDVEAQEIEKRVKRGQDHVGGMPHSGARRPSCWKGALGLPKTPPSSPPSLPDGDGP